MYFEYFDKKNLAVSWQINDLIFKPNMKAWFYLFYFLRFGGGLFNSKLYNIIQSTIILILEVPKGLCLLATYYIYVKYLIILVLLQKKNQSIKNLPESLNWAYQN